MSNGWYPSWENVQSLARTWSSEVPEFAGFLPLNEFVAPLELTPEEKAWEASGYKEEPAGWEKVLTGISGFINSTFPTVLSAITGRPIVPAGGAAAKAAPKTLAQYVPELLLVAGVAVLGVVGALMLFRPRAK